MKSGVAHKSINWDLVLLLLTVYLRFLPSASRFSLPAGLLGANFGPNLMTAVGIKDTIARGLAAAGTAGGLGTASLTSKVRTDMRAYRPGRGKGPLGRAGARGWAPTGEVLSRGYERLSPT